MALPDANDVLMELMFLVEKDVPPTREITKKLNELASVVAANGEGTRDQVLGLGAYAIVCRAWIVCCYSGVPKVNASTPGAKKCQDAVLRTLYSLSAGHPGIIDDVGWQIVTQVLDKSTPEQTLILLLKFLRNIFIKSEANREHFSWNLSLMDPLIKLISKSRPSSLLLREWCASMKALILSDDAREVYNRAPERKRMISRTHVLPLIAGHLNHQDYENDEGTLNSVVVLLASMAITDEICVRIEAGGNVLPGIHAIFRTHFYNKTLVRNTLSLLRYLCTNQYVREKSSTFALMKWVVDILVHYKNDPDVIEAGVTCCAYMTLRNSCQTSQFIAKNGLQTLLQIMNDYPKDIPILKSACFTLRNALENGGSDAKDKIRELGIAAYLPDLMLNIPDLREFHIKPILQELKSTRKASINSIYVSPTTAAGSVTPRVETPETILFEPQVGRKSVILDDLDDATN